MELMESINDKTNIMDVIEEKLKLTRIKELNIALSDIRRGLSSNDLIDSIESTYEFNLQKFKEARKLEKLSIAKRKKFLKMISYVERLGLNDTNTLSTVLTTAVILTKYDNEPENIKDENLYLLSSAFISIPLENYEIYKGLVDDEVLDSICSKSSNYFDMRNICYDLLDECERTELTSELLKESVAKYENDNINKIK